jgi:hypothetical protein
MKYFVTFHQNPWRLAKVDRLWPRWYDEARFDRAATECYRCIDYVTGEFIFVRNDTDDCIAAMDDTMHRFCKGDRVVFRTRMERWVEGTVVSTFLGRETEFFVGYSVRLGVGRMPGIALHL